MNHPEFSFDFVSFEHTLDGIDKLNSKIASQTTDIKIPIIKESKDVLALYI